MSLSRNTLLAFFASLAFLLSSQGHIAADEYDHKKGVSAHDMEKLLKIRELFQENCAECHGYDGVPILPEAPDFSKGERLEKKDSELMESIAKGLGDIMPPWEEELSEEQRENVLDYVKWVVGDSLFQEKCSSCHNISVPPIDPSIPLTKEAILAHPGPIQFCKGKRHDTLMSREEIYEILTFLRSIPTEDSD